MKFQGRWLVAGIASVAMAISAAAQTTYQPKSPKDPARSESEFVTLAYMRTLLRAEHLYKKKHDHYTKSLNELVHTGTFTRRMANPDRGDYTVGFRPHKEGFQLTLTPKQMDEQHRSFYAEEDGVIHGDSEKPANENSPVVK